MLQRIQKSRMSKISIKHGNAVVAHFTEVGKNAPLCQAKLPRGAYWITQGESMFAPERDCRNCRVLAQRRGLPLPPTMPSRGRK